jgi:F-type H+-transporting ATPase subunit epsilon
MEIAVVSPEGTTYTGEASMVVCRTVGGGDIAFMAGHVPFIGVLAIHEAKVVNDDGEVLFAVHQGFVQIAGETVTILSDVSEVRGDIDVARAEAAKAQAEAALGADEDDEKAAAALARAETRLRVAHGEVAGAH